MERSAATRAHASKQKLNFVTQRVLFGCDFAEIRLWMGDFGRLPRTASGWLIRMGAAAQRLSLAHDSG